MFLPEIASDKLKLRPFLATDLEVWMQWDTDPEVQKFMPERIPSDSTYESQQKFFEECESAQDELHAAITNSASGELIGTISLTDIADDSGELGIVLGNKNYWGKGYATEAIRVFLDTVTSAYKLKRIVAEFETRNIAVRKALENNGFYLDALCEKSRIKSGQPIDTFRYFKDV
jgi:[ribosomal protein S5]-alanine N-acetyltransferase